MPVKGKNVVVWEWCDDNVKWQPYLPEMSNYIEREHLSASSNVSLGKANQKFNNYIVNLKEMAQKNTQTGYLRPIRRNIYTSPSALADCSLWQWQTDYNSWQFFDEKATQQLEDAFKKKDTSVSLQSVGLPYNICLKTMTQTNTITGFQRNVRRVPNDYKTVRLTDACNRRHAVPQVQADTGPSSKKTKANTGSAAFSPKCERMRNMYTTPFIGELNEDCVICCEKLTASTDSTLVELNKCKHTFHTECFLSMCQASNTECLQCPICKCLYGIKTGNCPPGTFTRHHLKTSLPGYPTCGTIVIRYDIKDGIQGPEHPNPGKPYTARGFPRTGYLPDNPEGRKVADLLKEAWDRRLTFTIGSSVTTAESDTVVWNEIHHKTEMVDVNGHGYPDPNYLKNVLKELESHGVISGVTTS